MLQWLELNGPWENGSMLTLMYHGAYNYSSGGAIDELDFRKSKRHLNAWLQNLRDRNIQYLWADEFQRRGVVHYHVIMDRRFDDCALWDDKGKNSWRPLMESWLRITGQDEDKAAVDVALHQATYTHWNVFGRGYLSKYLQKSEQKGLPQGVRRFGRWWGCSRDLVSKMEIGRFEIVESVEGMKDVVECRERWEDFREEVKRYIENEFSYKFPTDELGERLSIRWIMDNGEQVNYVNSLLIKYFGRGVEKIESRPGWTFEREVRPEVVSMVERVMC
jgi:hypothetical protein